MPPRKTGGSAEAPAKSGNEGPVVTVPPATVQPSPVAERGPVLPTPENEDPLRVFLKEGRQVQPEPAPVSSEHDKLNASASALLHAMSDVKRPQPAEESSPLETGELSVFRSDMAKVLDRPFGEEDMRAFPTLMKFKAELEANPEGTAGHELAKVNYDHAYALAKSAYSKGRITTMRHLVARYPEEVLKLKNTKMRLKDVDPKNEEQMFPVKAAICCEELFEFSLRTYEDTKDTGHGVEMGYPYTNEFIKEAIEAGEDAVTHWEQIGKPWARERANWMRRKLLPVLSGVELYSAFTQHFLTRSRYAEMQARIYEKLGDVDKTLECLLRAQEDIDHTSMLSKEAGNFSRADNERMIARALADEIIRIKERLEERAAIRCLEEGKLYEAIEEAGRVLRLSELAQRKFKEEGNAFGELRQQLRRERFEKAIGEMKKLATDSGMAELTVKGSLPERGVAALIEYLKVEEISERTVAEMAPSPAGPSA